MGIRRYTLQEHVDGVPKRWAEQYPKNKNDPPKHAIGNKLNKLREPLDAADVNRIIGNSSWTRMHCDVCGEEGHLALTVFRYHYDPGHLSLEVCDDCLKLAVDQAIGALA